MRETGRKCFHGGKVGGRGRGKGRGRPGTRREHPLKIFPPVSETESCRTFVCPCLDLTEPANQKKQRGRQPAEV